MGKTSTFNKEKVFQERLKGLADEFSRICRQNNMPFFWTVCVENEQGGTRYVNDGASATGRGLLLTDDQISRHLAIVMGFDVTRPMDEIEAGYLNLGGAEEEIMYPEIE